MNKKEVSEIKKQFTFSNNLFNIDKISTFFISKNAISSSKTQRFADYEDYENGSSANCWDEIEEVCFFDIFKKTLGGQIGKSLVEYSFPLDIIQDVDKQYATLNKVFTDYTEENLLEYILFLIENLNLEQNYVIICAKCNYNIPKKDSGIKEDAEFSTGEMYDFLIFSICLVDNSKPTLEIDKKSEVSHVKTFRQLSAPQLGFLYPVFNERSSDTGSVLIFNKKIKEPCLSLIENCLGCKYELEPEEEQKRFNNLIAKISDETVNYDLSKNIHQKVSDIIEKTSINTEITEFSKNEIKDILVESGVDEKDLEKFDEIYEEEIGDFNLKAVNLVTNKKMDIKSSDISISVKNESLDKISSKIINGNKCLVIELNESVEINGMSVKV